MKKEFLRCMALAILMVLVSFGSVFAAPNKGFYVGVFGGYVIPQKVTISAPDDAYYYFDNFDMTLNNGYIIGVKSGWNTSFTRGIMAMEIEYNYLNSNIDNSKVIASPDHGGVPVTLDGTMTTHAVLFNVKARYPQGPIHPYAGFGMGYAYSSFGDITERAVEDTGVEIWNSESGGGFCWQFLTGVDFDVTPNLSVSVGYKYFVTNPTIGERYNMYIDADYRASIFTAGLTFTF
jgi:opacity protein-like surface antigen